MGLFNKQTDKVVKMVDAPEMVILEDQHHNLQVRFTKKVTFEAGNVIALATSTIFMKGVEEGKKQK